MYSRRWSKISPVPCLSSPPSFNPCADHGWQGNPTAYKSHDGMASTGLVVISSYVCFGLADCSVETPSGRVLLATECDAAMARKTQRVHCNHNRIQSRTLSANCNLFVDRHAESVPNTTKVSRLRTSILQNVSWQTRCNNRNLLADFSNVGRLFLACPGQTADISLQIDVIPRVHGASAWELGSPEKLGKLGRILAAFAKCKQMHTQTHTPTHASKCVHMRNWTWRYGAACPRPCVMRSVFFVWDTFPNAFGDLTL